MTCPAGQHTVSVCSTGVPVTDAGSVADSGYGE
jgi:hypothetical protein